jgi:hypothetical protein
LTHQSFLAINIGVRRTFAETQIHFLNLLTYRPDTPLQNIATEERPTPLSTRRLGIIVPEGGLKRALSRFIASPARPRDSSTMSTMV